MEPLQPEVMPRLPAAPDLSSLPNVNFDAMLITVTDQASANLALTYRKTADDYIKNVGDMLEETTSAANKIHKFFTAMKARMISKPTAVKLHCNTQLMAFKQLQELNSRTLEAELQRRADEQVKRQRDEEIADRMLFGGDVAAIQQAPLELAKVSMPVARVAGLSTAKKPWSYRVDSFMDLVKAVAAGEASPECLMVNGPFLTQMARDYKDKLSERCPGVVGIQGERIKQ